MVLVTMVALGRAGRVVRVARWSCVVVMMSVTATLTWPVLAACRSTVPVRMATAICDGECAAGSTGQARDSQDRGYA